MKTKQLRNSSPVHRSSCFTLMEIVFVIGIMTILLAISMPAFTSMIKGGGVNAAQRNVSQVLKLARNHAINNNQYVAVLFPMYTPNGGNQYARPKQSRSGLDDRFYNRSYRVCTVSKSGSDYVFKRWINGADWEYLPAGAGFLEVDGDKGVDNDGSNLIPKNGSLTYVQRVDYSDADGIKITATGWEYLTAAIIFKPSGRPADFGRKYVEIGEATFSNEMLIVTNPDVKAYASITIDQYTGRVASGSE